MRVDAPETLEILVDGAGSGAWNMAVDHALMARARQGCCSLRLYRWDPACLSLGRNQRARARYRRRGGWSPGADLVRRPTGGRAVYHSREITYAVTAPEGLWGGLRQSYRRINSALARALAGLGVPVEIQERRAGARTPGPSNRACFRDPLPGEVVVDGRKLVGSAQWRNDGALLQHGSILLDDEQRRAEELREVPGDGDSTGRHGEEGQVRAASLASCLGAVPGADRLQAVLRQGFAREFGLRPRELPEAGSVRARAEGLLGRYRGEEWTWRR